MRSAAGLCWSEAEWAFRPSTTWPKKLIDKGRKVTVVLGFNTASEVFYEEEFRALSAEVFVTTADGTHGTKGFVTTAIAEKKPDLIIFTPAARCRCCVH